MLFLRILFYSNLKAITGTEEQEESA